MAALEFLLIPASDANENIFERVTPAREFAQRPATLPHHIVNYRPQTNPIPRRQRTSAVRSICGRDIHMQDRVYFRPDLDQLRHRRRNLSYHRARLENGFVEIIR